MITASKHTATACVCGGTASSCSSTATRLSSVPGRLAYGPRRTPSPTSTTSESSLYDDHRLHNGSDGRAARARELLAPRSRVVLFAPRDLRLRRPDCARGLHAAG